MQIPLNLQFFRRRISRKRGLLLAYHFLSLCSNVDSLQHSIINVGRMPLAECNSENDDRSLKLATAFNYKIKNDKGTKTRELQLNRVEKLRFGYCRKVREGEGYGATFL